MMRVFGGIEAGGTKFVCAVGSAPGDLEAEETIPTTTPVETISKVISFFSKFHDRITAIGVGTFGPVDLNPSSETYGYITNTPKLQWRQTPLIGQLGRALNLPIVFDTDSNVAAVGEAAWGNAQGLNTFVYLTIGTGIGGGVIINDKPLHGILHPEIGHMRLPHDREKDRFSGTCPYHGDCWEGLAAGPAILQRWKSPGELIPPDHQAWILEAQYLSLGLVNLICTLAPQRIIMGGGVMQQTTLFSRIQANVQQLLNGYLIAEQLQESIEQYIVPPKLGRQAGVLGGIALAQRASN